MFSGLRKVFISSLFKIELLGALRLLVNLAFRLTGKMSLLSTTKITYLLYIHNLFQIIQKFGFSLVFSFY